MIVINIMRVNFLEDFYFELINDIETLNEYSYKLFYIFEIHYKFPNPFYGETKEICFE